MEEPLIPQPPPHMQGPPDDPDVGGGLLHNKLPEDLPPLHDGARSPLPPAVGNKRPRRNTRLSDRYTDTEYDVSALMYTDHDFAFL